MPRHRRAAAKGDVREQLLHAATGLIGARGFAGISIQDVASEVGVTKQSLLYHFDGKDELKLAVIDHLMTRANESLNTLLGELPAHQDDRLETILSHINTFLEQEPHAAAVFLRFLLDRDQPAIDRIRSGARPWFGFLEDALRSAKGKSGVRKDLDPEIAVLQVGMLVITNFALLPINWTDKANASWRKRRLRELVRSIGFILFDTDR